MVGQGTMCGRSEYHVWKVMVPGMVGQGTRYGMVGQGTRYGRSGYQVW